MVEKSKSIDNHTSGNRYRLWLWWEIAHSGETKDLRVPANVDDVYDSDLANGFYDCRSRR